MAVAPAAPAAAPLDPAALQRLLALRGRSFETAAVAGALDVAGARGFGDGEASLRALEAALGKLGLHGAELATARVRTVQPSHCPLLVEHDGRCRVLREVAGAVAVIEDESGQRVEARLDAIESARVLWLRLGTDTIDLPHERERPAFALLRRALLRRRRVLGEVAVATLLTGLLAIASSLFSQQVYDRVVPSFATSTLWALVAILGTLMIFDFVLRVLRARMLDRVACDIDDELSAEVFHALGDIRLDARPPAVGTLAAQVSGLESARAFFTSSVLFTLAEVPFAIVFVAVIAMLGGPIAWVYVAAAVAALVVGLATQARVRRLTAAQQAGQHQRNGLLVESIAGSETIKALGAGWRFTERWHALTRRILDQSRALRSAQSLAGAFAGSLATQAYVAVMVWGVFLIEAGQLTVGALTAVTLLGARVIGPITNAVTLLAQAHSARLALGAVDAVLKLPPDREPGVATLRPAVLEPHLAVEGLRFAYGQSPVPQVDVERLELRAGDRVVLIGTPGCGKSTLLRLLAGLYRPSTGRVRAGGVDVALLDPDVLRRAVALVPQEVQLFRGTLRDNLTLGWTPDDARLVEVVSALGLDALVSEHPRGLERPINEGGSGLSIGQRQLCGAARALVRAPRVLLLDEPGAALDPRTEQRLYQALERLLAPTDILVIATHRPAAAQLCTRALVMQRGRIVRDGARAALLADMRAAAVQQAVAA